MTQDGDVGGDDTNALKAQLTAAVARPDIPSAKVRELVCALVDKMKAEGAPPEKVVIAVKSAVLGDRALRAVPDPGQLKEAEKVLQQALSWCIQQYYGAA